MSLALTVAPAIRFHLSLNVSNLSRSIDFYRVLFGIEPAKRRPDYAKFELDDPPVVLSLAPTAPGKGGPLNHLGFRLPNSQTLVAMQERLARAGISSQREEGVECCYALQTKFWVTDPDRTLWEIYTLHEDIDHFGAGQTLEEMLPTEHQHDLENAANLAPGREPVVFEHTLMNPVTDRLPFDDEAVDEVRLRGSFNVPLRPENQAKLVREAWRILRPGGRVFAHTLVGEQVVVNPGLPGPAALVQEVPLETSPVHLLEQAGFQALRLIKFDAKPCFERAGVAMREQQLEGFKPVSGAEQVTVIYKGPFRQVCADDGTVFVRGQRVSVPGEQAERLRSGEWAGQFLVLG